MRHHDQYTDCHVVQVSDRPDGLFPTVVVDEQGVALGLVYSSCERYALLCLIRASNSLSPSIKFCVHGEIPHCQNSDT